MHKYPKKILSRLHGNKVIIRRLKKKKWEMKNMRKKKELQWNYDYDEQTICIWFLIYFVHFFFRPNLLILQQLGVHIGRFLLLMIIWIIISILLFSNIINYIKNRSNRRSKKYVKMRKKCKKYIRGKREWKDGWQYKRYWIGK